MKKWLLISVLIGIVVNILLAWSLAFVRPSFEQTVVTISDSLEWLSDVPDDWPKPTHQNFSQSLGCSAKSVSVSHDSIHYWQATFTYGLPFQSMVLEMRRVTDEKTGQVQEELLWGVKTSIKRPNTVRACLPLRPMWLGFIANSVIYGGICWVGIAGVLFIQQWWRIKRRLCPKCAYPIGKSQLCTECGHELL